MAAIAAQKTQLMTVNQLAGMSPSQRAAYLAAVDPQNAAAAHANAKQARAIANARYLSEAIENRATCMPTAGGIQAAWAASTDLIYNLPTVNGGFVKELLITLNLSVTPATGTAATYAVNAAGIFGLLQEIRVELGNGTQLRLPPYLLKALSQLRGYGRANYGDVIAGNADANITAATDSGTPIVINSANTWNRIFRVPLNAIHPHSPAGILPIMGSSTPGQVHIVTSNSPLGADPELSAVAATGGTGNALTITGTVKCEAIVTDGTNGWSPSPLGLDLSGEPTAQYVIDTPLQPLAAGSVQRQKISSLLQHYTILAIVIDGNQSTKFSANSNVIGFELDKDSVGQNKFYAYGSGTNVSMNDYFEQIRNRYGQDLDEGVFLLNAANLLGENPSNNNGRTVINMESGGWTDVHHGWQVTSVGGVAGISPRVQLALVSMNSLGLQLG